MAVIDVAGFVADVKSQAIDHGFHVHDERHFVETYSLRQVWEVDLHPEEACVRPDRPAPVARRRPTGDARLRGRDHEARRDDDDPPPNGFSFPLLFTWTLPPLPDPPDLLVLATDLAGIGGIDLPVEVSAIDSFPSVTDAPERSLSIVARCRVDLADVYMNVDDAITARTLDRCQTCQSVPARPGGRLARRGLRLTAPCGCDQHPQRRHRPGRESPGEVHELIEILRDQPADTEVELGIIAPVEDEDQITVDRYFVDGVLPWEDDTRTATAPASRALARRRRGSRRQGVPRRHRTTRRLTGPKARRHP